MEDYRKSPETGVRNEMGEAQELPASSYKISKACTCNTHRATTVNNTALHI